MSRDIMGKTKYKDTRNVITICDGCGQCIDCCDKGLVCESYHLDKITLHLASVGNITES